MSDLLSLLQSALTGRYEIERELGSGGSATVYLARDARHDRQVAIKVLRPELAGAAAGNRFLSEIRTVANFQHPHILPLFDSGRAGDLVFYVMPFVAGESLRDRLAREQQLPVEAAVRIASEIAEALHYAHSRGVVHRDIKPGNILLNDGRALVADFGIALALSRASGERVTETGLSIGTPHYMSPEQATGGQAVDARTDVYSLGVLLYEMLAGRPPHEGHTPQAVLTSVLMEVPRSVREHRRTVPRHVGAAIDMALEKIPADRFADAAEFARALADPTFAHDTGGSPLAAGRGPLLKAGSLRGYASLLGISVLSVAAGVWLKSNWSSSEPADPAPPTFRTTLPIPEGLSGSRPFAISRDGTHLAYAAVGPDGLSMIKVRRLSDEDVRSVQGTTRGTQPTFSPDGNWIAFVRGDSLLKVRLDGGAPVFLARAPFADSLATPLITQPSWSDDGNVYFVSRPPLDSIRNSPTDAIYRVREESGQPELMITPDHSGTSYRQPTPLPGGRALLFTALSRVFEQAEIRVLDLTTREARRVIGPGVDPHYVDGVLLYGTREQALNAVPFDMGRLEAVGTPVQVIAPLQVSADGPAAFAVSENGVAVYRAGRATNGVGVEIWDADQLRTRLDIDGLFFFDPRFSPNGRLLSYMSGAHLYVRDLELGASRQLTHTADNWGLVWINDSTFIFRSNRADPRGRAWDLYRQRLGAAEPDQHYELAEDHFPVAWIGDDQLLVYEFTDPASPDIVVLSFAGSSVTRTAYLEAQNWGEGSPALSPDRRWLVYASNESGEYRVYARSYPDPAASQRIPISEGPGGSPLWGPSGDIIYYVVGQDLHTATLRAGDPREVLARSIVLSGISSGPILWRRQYDIHRETGRLVFLSPNSFLAPTGPPELTLVVNWFAEMRQRMGAQRP